MESTMVRSPTAGLWESRFSSMVRGMEEIVMLEGAKIASV